MSSNDWFYTDWMLKQGAKNPVKKQEEKTQENTHEFSILEYTLTPEIKRQTIPAKEIEPLNLAGVNVTTGMKECIKAKAAVDDFLCFGNERFHNVPIVDVYRTKTIEYTRIGKDYRIQDFRSGIRRFLHFWIAGEEVEMAKKIGQIPISSMWRRFLENSSIVMMVANSKYNWDLQLVSNNMRVDVEMFLTPLGPVRIKEQQKLQLCKRLNENGARKQ